MACFLRNDMKQFECTLLHVCASRQRIWSLHLATQEELSKYFCAHDHFNNAQFNPVYCEEMQCLEWDDLETWSALASCEKLSRKVLGGIVGLAQSEPAMDKLFLVVPELSQLVKVFGNLNCFDLFDQWKYHHPLSDSVGSRCSKEHI